MELLVSEARNRGVEKLQLGATDAGLTVYERVGFEHSRYPYLEMKL